MNEEVTKQDESTSDSPKCVFTGLSINNFGRLKDVGRNGIDGVNTLAGPVHRAGINQYNRLLDETRDALREAIGIGRVPSLPKGISDMIPDIAKMCIAEKVTAREAIRRQRNKIEAVMDGIHRARAERPSQAAFAY
jgi:hypothetical protein